LANFVYVIVMS